MRGAFGADVAGQALFRVEVERKLGAEDFHAGALPQRLDELVHDQGDVAVVGSLDDIDATRDFHHLVAGVGERFFRLVGAGASAGSRLGRGWRPALAGIGADAPVDAIDVQLRGERKRLADFAQDAVE